MASLCTHKPLASFSSAMTQACQIRLSREVCRLTRHYLALERLTREDPGRQSAHVPMKRPRQWCRDLGPLIEKVDICSSSGHEVRVRTVFDEFVMEVLLPSGCIVGRCHKSLELSLPHIAQVAYLWCTHWHRIRKLVAIKARVDTPAYGDQESSADDHQCDVCMCEKNGAHHDELSWRIREMGEQ
jgi:hypothetical protein